MASAKKQTIEKKFYDCIKCDGGVIKSYSHIKGGVCFTCNGKGRVLQKTKPRQTKKFEFQYHITEGVNASDGLQTYYWKNFSSLNKANQFAEKSMLKIGAIAFKVIEVVD